MKKIGNIVCLLLGLVICLYCYVEVEMSDCNNGAGYCDYYSSYLRCYISNNETQLIKSLISYCSSQSTGFYRLYLEKYYVSTTYGNLIIGIELPINIQQLYIRNHQDQDNLRITTSSQNTGLTRIYSDRHIQLESNNFFNYFTGLQYIYMGNIISSETPSFTNLQYLTYLQLRIVGSVTRTIDNTIVRGLSNLVELRLANSNFDNISEGAFDGLDGLTYLNLENNKLSIIEDGTFSEVSNLLRLYLSNNGINLVSNNVFKGLTELTYLSLSGNPGFPIEAILRIISLVNLYLQYNEYRTLDPYVFQQMKSLTRIYLNDPFICDCRLQWMSTVSKYGVNIFSGVCSEPTNFFQKSINSPQLYTNCSQTESYQCFNKSITCPSNEVCHNTEDSYFCSCPIGYSKHSSGECKDFDECNEETNCQHSCENTEGSYHCVCDEGYKLATNGYDCEDVNECQEGNGGCEFGCRNTIGSYQCHCEYGHKLNNETDCEEGIECELMGDTCIDPLESRYNCKGGFNLSIIIHSCPNVNSQENIQPNETTNQTTEQTTPFTPMLPTTQIESGLTIVTILPVALMSISLVFNVFTTLVIIALLIYLVRKSKNMKCITVAKDTTETQIKLKCFNNESIYNSIDELPQPDNSENKPKFESSPMLGKYQNIMEHQTYPGKMKDETADYETL